MNTYIYSIFSGMLSCHIWQISVCLYVIPVLENNNLVNFGTYYYANFGSFLPVLETYSAIIQALPQLVNCLLCLYSIARKILFDCEYHFPVLDIIISVRNVLLIVSKIFASGDEL